MALPHLSIKLDGTTYWLKVPETSFSSTSELLDISAGKQLDSRFTGSLKHGCSKKLSMGSQVVGKLSQFLCNWSPPLIISSSCLSNGLGSKTSCLFGTMLRNDKGFLLACSTDIHITTRSRPHQNRGIKLKEILSEVPVTTKTQFRY